MEVLFEDDYLIIVNKPSGMPSQATLDPKREHCYAATIRYLEQRQAGEVYVGLHHRLDALTSGVILMTKDKCVNASISEQFQSHTIEKDYCAICCGGRDVAESYRTPGRSWVIDAPIGELPGGRVQKFGVNGKKRKSAKTRVVCEAVFALRDGVCGVYKCSPLTGRTHQIRVHMSSLGLGIIGDPLYSPPLLRSLRSIDPGRLCLHAENLCFVHPVSGVRQTVSACRPQAFEVFLKKLSKLSV